MSLRYMLVSKLYRRYTVAYANPSFRFPSLSCFLQYIIFTAGHISTIATDKAYHLKRTSTVEKK